MSYFLTSTNPPRSTNRGFSLLELLITLVIIAILSAIVLPLYQQYVSQSYRVEAKNTLLSLAIRLEQNYTLNASYTQQQAAAPAAPGTLEDIDNNSIKSWGLDQTPLAGNARYLISFQPNSLQVTAFTLQATPTGAQASDICGVLTLDNRNLKGAAGKNNRDIKTRDCWDR